MRIVVAPDSFKGCATAAAVARSIESGIRRVWPQADIDKIPIADGGEGTVEALVEATTGNIVKTRVKDPLGRTIDSFYGILGDGVTGVIEMAAASGLPLLQQEEYNPLVTTTYGTGQLIAAALGRGLKRIIIGIGGSATNDGGAGMAQALGAKLRDSAGRESAFGGEALLSLAGIDTECLLASFREADVIVACDVTNPLTGPNGASAVYGPQKGATPGMVQILDRALSNYANIIRRDLGKDVEYIPGAGAAGGLGAGLLAFSAARLMPGVDIVLETVKFKERLTNADLVITGEGSLDSQTIYGKAPAGVAAIAAEFGIPAVALAGKLGSGVEQVLGAGIKGYLSVVPGPVSLDEALTNGEEYIADAAERLVRLIDVGRLIKL